MAKNIEIIRGMLELSIFDFYKDGLYKVLHTKENYLFKYNLNTQYHFKFFINNKIKTKIKSNIDDLREYNFKQNL